MLVGKKINNFATHLQYLLKRVFAETHTGSDNLRMYKPMWEEYPKVSACVDRISGYYRDAWAATLTEEENILHVNRVCSQETV